VLGELAWFEVLACPPLFEQAAASTVSVAALSLFVLLPFAALQASWCVCSA
jgi:hypothetical protein